MSPESFMLSWNLRNTVEGEKLLKSLTSGIQGTHLGRFPMDDWEPHYIEVPKDGTKKDISGRFSCSKSVKKKGLNQYRVVELPTYVNSEALDAGRLRSIINRWEEIGISTDLPCVALAIKYTGMCSDWREVQFCCVLLLWNDSTARIAVLDWSEGPLEDCITPEWFLECTPLMTIHQAFDRISGIIDHIDLKNTRYFLYSNPACICTGLGHGGEPCDFEPWGREWQYEQYDAFVEMVSRVRGIIEGLFEEQNDPGDRHNELVETDPQKGPVNETGG